MNARRLSDIVKALLLAKRRGARLSGKSVLERELQAWFDEPPINLTGATLPMPSSGELGYDVNAVAPVLLYDNHTNQ